MIPCRRVDSWKHRLNEGERHEIQSTEAAAKSRPSGAGSENRRDLRDRCAVPDAGGTGVLHRLLRLKGSRQGGRIPPNGGLRQELLKSAAVCRLGFETQFCLDLLLN